MRSALLAGLGLLAACSDYEISPKTDEGGGDDTAPPTCEDFSPDAHHPLPPDTNCLREPEVGTFTPQVEWQWNSNPEQPGYDDIMAAPAVGNLDDDNGDGRVDADDIPDVVFTNFAGGAYSSAGALTAIRGDGTGTLWSVTAPGGYTIYSSSGVALGDLDGNGTVEVCVSGTTVGVVCVNGADGSFLWAAGSEIHGYGCPAIADLEGDGRAEVIFGRQVFDFAGNTVFVGTEGHGGPHYMSYAVDWDDDGELEIVAGRTVYETDGSVLWSDPSNNDASAVGDFDGDGRPDLVRVGSGMVRLNLNDGSEVWSTSIPGGGNGGPPTVADFDGDGEVEVGVAGLAYYTMFDTDGSVLWSNPTSDYSSSQTGSSVFDFEGDGASEVVYADEHNLWIYEGATGAVRMQQDGHASGTLMEYPLIADVDNDGSTEIIVASNDYTYSGWNGITVLGDADDSWVPARPIWNQYAYHITNVENDGSIPQLQQQNWLSWNSFRAGGTELGPSHWQPDLSVVEAEVCLETCWKEEVQVYLVVRNLGLLDAVGVEVSLGANGVLGSQGFPMLSAGRAEVAGPFAVNATEWGSGALFAHVDGTDQIEECDETNNSFNLERFPCDEEEE